MRGNITSDYLGQPLTRQTIRLQQVSIPSDEVVQLSEPCLRFGFLACPFLQGWGIVEFMANIRFQKNVQRILWYPSQSSASHALLNELKIRPCQNICRLQW